MDVLAEPEFDLLAIDRGTITAPAGCGKTHLIAGALARHMGPKPILVLTHTNAGVAALRGRLKSAGVSPSRYRLATIDGWAMRLISTFPKRSELDPEILKLERPATDYPAIRRRAARLLRAGHISDVLAATYERLLVDEYQDCSVPQHAIVAYAAQTLRTCVLGDPLQAIFGFAEPLADWEEHVCAYFPLAGELSTPWRWINAGAEPFGRWLLEARQLLLAGQPIDLRTAPANVTWVQLDGRTDHEKRLHAGRAQAPSANGSVLIIGDSRSPPGQRQFASQTPGAVTVESVDLRDLVSFAHRLDLRSAGALSTLVDFACSVMTNVGGPDFLRRVDTLRRGTARNQATAAETAALSFCSSPSHAGAIEVLVELNKEGGVRTHRPGVLAGCIKALRGCEEGVPGALHQAVVRVREENRLLGRPLPRRAVGSTLLLKGLEAEVAVVLEPQAMDRHHLYVAITRGSKALLVCSSTPVLQAH